MDENAAKWLQMYKKKHGLGDWQTFIAAVEQKFGDNDYRTALTQLLELQQGDTMEAYILEFEDVQCQITMHNADAELGELFFVTQFMKGLKLEISAVVQAQVPDNMKRAILLARTQQQVLDKNKGKWPKGNAPSKQLQPLHKGDSKTNGQASTLWRERQSRDYRRANGLCYFCAEPFDANHRSVCTKRPQPQAQINALVVNDLDVVLTEEVLTHLAIEDAIIEDFGQLSLNAMSGTDIGEVMKVRSLVKNKVMLILIDSGSSHIFVSESFLDTVGIKSLPTKPRKVQLANGEHLITYHYVPQLEWWVDGYTMHTYLQVLPLMAYDAILGYDWLAPHSPMNCHWENRTLQFVDQGSDITIQGIKPVEKKVEEVPVEQLLKWDSGNDVWALAVLEEVSDQVVMAQEKAIQELLQEYQDVFSEPKALPPPRFYDHQIPLLPNAAPVNARPYRYSPHHKDEIEKQVKQLLEDGLIVHSTSPFASPVILVLKKDGCWRFCIDYRKLNSITVKNKFPMPLIDEILDELARTKYFTKLDMRSGYHQVRMKPKDEYQTAFKTHQGHYQFKVMPFGLTNAPATFKCVMNEVLKPFLCKFVMVFLDDILIYSQTMDLHLKHIRLVLQKLREHKFYMKVSKCSFAQTKLEYLGHILERE
jgi:hypothetical protein